MKIKAAIKNTFATVFFVASLVIWFASWKDTGSFPPPTDAAWLMFCTFVLIAD